ncbi:hypothetical protein HanRHA438_Chr04g0168831 [Helianthus annuus]|nr:hypothetical protein HanRHA438_Chr04g0168831 [Helianthus annuus]
MYLMYFFRFWKSYMLTTPRVALARPRVELGICLLLFSLSVVVNSHRARLVLGEHGPMPKLLFLLFLGFGCGWRLGKLRQSFFIAFYVGFCCLFASFVLLSSFNPVY